MIEGNKIHSGEAGAGDDGVVAKVVTIAGAVLVMRAAFVRDVMSFCCGMRRFRWRGALCNVSDGRSISQVSRSRIQNVRIAKQARRT